MTSGSVREPGPDAPARPGRRRGWLLRAPVIAWAAGLIAACAALFWCYLLESRSVQVNSDGASQVLQAWDMLHGNVLLSGWWLTDVSFYTLEIPLDALVASVRGLTPDVVHVTAALVYTALVLSAALLARGTARGREGAVRAALAAGVMLAPGVSSGDRVLLLSPDHTGTGVPLLLTFLLVDRARQRRWVAVAAGAMLTWAQADDSLAMFAGALPVLGVCLARFVVAARRGERGTGDLALALAAGASIGLARLTLAVIGAAGGFYVHPVVGGEGLAPITAIPRQLVWTLQNVLVLFGANYSGQPSALDTEMAWLHMAGVALALCGLLLGIRVLFARPERLRRADRVTQIVTAGTLITLAAGAFGTHMAPIEGAHEIAVVLPFGAVLAGRTAGPLLAAAPPGQTARVARGAVASLLAVLAACYVWMLGYAATRPARPAANLALAGWLAEHHLTSGLGGYWEANATSLASGGRVRIAPIAGGGGEAYPWNSRSQWYDPRMSYANFVVLVAPPLEDSATVASAGVLATFGTPAHSYVLGKYTIMVWNRNILASLPPAQPGQV